MRTKLENICKGYVKNIAQKDLTNHNGSYPIYGASGYIKDIDFYISDREYLGIIKDGAGVGRVDKYPAYSSLLGTMQYIVPNNDVDINYLKYLLISLHLENGVSGAAIPHIYYKNYKNTNVNICSFEEQIKIAKCLDDINHSISIAQKRLFTLDELVKSRFIEMFGDIDLSSQKADWMCLSELGTIYTGTTPSTADIDNWDGDILWITPAEMNDDSFFIDDTVRKITQKGAKSKSLSLMPVGTVLLSTRAPIGKVGIVASPMTCNQGFKNFYCPNTLNSIYLYVLLKNNTQYLNAIGTGTTFKEISKTTCGNIRIPVPPIKLQNEFAEFVKLIDKSKFIVQQQIKDLQELLDSKMDEYFR